jgi:murein L,D-transpeptidase YafK
MLDSVLHDSSNRLHWSRLWKKGRAVFVMVAIASLRKRGDDRSHAKEKRKKTNVFSTTRQVYRETSVSFLSLVNNDDGKCCFCFARQSSHHHESHERWRAVESEVGARGR